MKKLAVFAMATLAILSSLTGCAKPASADFLIDSKNYFEIGVPNGSEVLFHAPWYRVSTQDYMEDPDFNASVFIVGQTAELSGMNVDQLDGATIYVQEHELSEYVDAEYYRNIYRELSYLNGITPETNLFGDLRTRDVAKVRNALKGYVANARILSCDLAFEGAITKEVRVDSIEIPSIHYQAAFDLFHVTPLAIPRDQSQEVYGTYIAGGWGGMLIGRTMSQSNYCTLEGSVKSAIRNIRLEAVNDSCIVLDETNDQDFTAYSGGFNDRTMNVQNTGPFEAGDEIYLAFEYLYLGKTPEKFKQYDSVVACLRYIITLEDGTELNSYTYQSSVREPEYALVRLLLNES